EVEALAAGSESATTGRGYRVLVVEDNDEVGQFSMELLEDLGYAAKRVANADAALAILAQDEFAADLVFSDVIMPGMNGVELAGVLDGLVGILDDDLLFLDRFHYDLDDAGIDHAERPGHAG